VALRLSANLSFLFADRPWGARFDAAADAGFAGVELNPPMPYLETPAQLARRLKGHRLACPLIVAPLGEGDAALGHACLPGAEADFRDSIRRAIDYADAAAIPLIHPSAGRLPPGVARAEGERVYADNLAWAAECVRGAGVRLCIEPVCEMRTPGFFLQTLGQARDLIARSGSKDIGLVFDVFHVEQQEGDALARLGDVLPDVVHVQVSDMPNRHVPGTGTIDFPALFRALDEGGYQGWIGCEYDDATGSGGFEWAAGLSHVPLRAPAMTNEGE